MILDSGNVSILIMALCYFILSSERLTEAHLSRFITKSGQLKCKLLFKI